MVFELNIVLGSVISPKVCGCDVIGGGGIICELLLLKTRARGIRTYHISGFSSVSLKDFG